MRALIHSGALDGDARACRANATTRSWIRRQVLDPERMAGQHRRTVVRDGLAVNLAESPLARLAVAVPGAAEPFLARHHVEAGERVRTIVDRADIQPRVTMSYSAARTAGSRQNHAVDVSDLAADARKALAEIHRVLPRDCAGVVIDVCGLLKGLQQVEAERRWPRRSAKLVLRIGLDRLAEHYGLGSHAVGVATRRRHNWIGDDARPDRFE